MYESQDKSLVNICFPLSRRIDHAFKVRTPHLDFYYLYTNTVGGPPSSNADFWASGKMKIESKEPQDKNALKEDMLVLFNIIWAEKSQ